MDKKKNVIDEFNEFEKDKLPFIKAALTATRLSLPSEPENLWLALKETEKYYGYLQFLVAKADIFLDKAADFYLDIVIAEEGDKLAAYEKKVRVDAKCADIRGFRNTVNGLLEAAGKRISLGQTRIKYQTSLYVESPVKAREQRGGKDNG